LNIFRVLALVYALTLTIVGCALTESEDSSAKEKLKVNLDQVMTEQIVPPARRIKEQVKVALNNEREYTPEELKELTCLARNMYFEAATEGFEGWVAVANATINRVNSPKFPDTICKVVYDKYQFSWTINDRYTKPRDKKLFNNIYSVAKMVYNGVIGDLSEGATYYHATYIKTPYWVKGENLKHTVTIGLHKFYKE
jgi:spore germination cell wall hydrolase CwlJ-like protein